MLLPFVSALKFLLKALVIVACLPSQELAQNVLHEVFGERVQRFVVSFIHLVHPEIEHQSAQRATWRSIVVDMMLIFAARDASGNVAELHDLANGHVGSDKIL